MALDLIMLPPEEETQLDLQPLEAAPLDLQPVEEPIPYPETLEALRPLGLEVPIPPVVSEFLTRMGKRFTEGQEAFQNLPTSARQAVVGDEQGERLRPAMQTLFGAMYPAMAPLIPLEASVEQALAPWLGEEKAEMAGHISSVPLTVGVGTLSRMGKLGRSGEDLARFLGVKGPGDAPIPAREVSRDIRELRKSELIQKRAELHQQITQQKLDRQREVLLNPTQMRKTSSLLEAAQQAILPDPGNITLGAAKETGMAQIPRLLPKVDDAFRTTQEMIERATGGQGQAWGQELRRERNLMSEKIIREAEARLAGGTARPVDLENLRYARRQERIASHLMGDTAKIPDIVEATSPRAKRLDQFKYAVGQAAEDLVSSFGAAGRTLSRTLNQAFESAETMKLRYFHGPEGALDLATRFKIKPGSAASRNITEVLEGTAQPMNEDVARIARVVRQQLDEVGDVTQSVGLEIRNPVTDVVSPWQPRENFVPRYRKDFDTLLQPKNQAARVQAVTDIQAEAAKAGKILTRGEAEKRLEHMIRNSRKEYGHLEIARVLNFGDYEKDFHVWYRRYMNDALERNALAQGFGGGKYPLADDLINLVGSETGSDWHQGVARQFFARATGSETFGPGMQVAQKIAQITMPLEVALKLGQATILNISQRFLPAMMGGYRNLARAWRDAVTDGGKEFGRLAGASVEQTTRELMDILMGQRSDPNVMARWSRMAGTKVLDISQFTKVEVQNRMIAANYGRHWANDLLRKLPNQTGNAAETSKRQLRKMGIEPMEALKRGMLTLDEEIAAGRHMIATTQFKINPRTLPMGITNPLGRMLAQFSTFAFKAGRFMHQEILKEAKQGNYAPIARYLLTLPVIGEGITDIKTTVTGRERTDNFLARYAENLAYVGGLGIFYDIVWASQHGETGVARRLLGPTFADATKIAGSVGSGDWEGLARHATQNIPIVGPSLRPRIWPPKERR